MSERVLPEGWINITLGELCELSPKQTLDDELEVGFMPMSGVPTTFHVKPEFENRKWEAVKKGYTQFKDGDVLFAKITPCFENGKATVVEGFPSGWGAGSTEYHVLRPRAEAVDPRLLLALVRTKDFLKNGELNMSGSVGHKRVPKEFVGGYPFPLMALAEQKVIADKLDELLAQVNNLKARLDAIPAILKRFRQSVLTAALSGNLAENSESGSDHREVVCIGDLAVDIRYGTSKKCSASKGSTAVLRIPNIVDSSVDKADLKYADFDEKEYSRLALKEGDLLLIRSSGSVDLVGRLAVISSQDVDFLFAGYLIRLRLDTCRAIPEFVALCLQSPKLRSVIEEKARSTSGVNNINSKELASLEIPLPAVIEQKKIVRRVYQLFAFADQIKQQVANAQARVDKLTQSILAKAFRGELTAEWRAQNPELISGEHSAEALLERIKAEKAKQKPAGRGRKKSAAEATG